MVHFQHQKNLNRLKKKTNNKPPIPKRNFGPFSSESGISKEDESIIKREKRQLKERLQEEKQRLKEEKQRLKEQRENRFNQIVPIEKKRGIDRIDLENKKSRPNYPNFFEDSFSPGNLTSITDTFKKQKLDRIRDGPFTKEGDKEPRTGPFTSYDYMNVKDGYVRNPNTNRQIKIGGPMYNYLKEIRQL